jgi:ribulose-phosphate 3-epimerase
MGILISPSVLNSDWIHLDIMDNHFVPNLTFGVPVVESLLKRTSIPADAHLMISDPDRWAPAYAEAGASSVTFHIEAAANPRQLCRDLRAAGARAGIGLKPGTGLSTVAELMSELDMILIMTVEPGFGGQSFMSDMLPKIEQARALAEATGTDIWVQVDGGIDVSTIERCASAGANVFVAGSSVYRAQDPGDMVDRLRALALAASTP